MSTLPTVFLDSVGLAAPGLPDWTSASAVLRGELRHVLTPLTPYQPTLLPANERRRACEAVRLVFRVAEQATLGCDTAGLATVFASSDGNLQIADRLCTALATPQRQVSPTDFHASVHNAAAGNWSIAAHSRRPSTAVAAWEDCFSVGLMEAVAMVIAEGADSLLVSYDLEPPSAMRGRSLATQTFGVALRLSKRASSTTLARLQLQWTDGAASSLHHPSLSAMYMASPAARCLPLLDAVARRKSSTVQLGGHSGYDSVLAVSVDRV